MKDIGIIRKLDSLGRIVIPKEMRRKLDISKKDEIEIYVDGSSIILKKYKDTSCSRCLTRCEHKDKYCRNCGLRLKI